MGGHRVYRERKYAFGQQLLALRTQLTLTQTQLAEQIGVHRRSVQKWEAGESYPKGETLHRMLAVFVRRGAFTSGREHAEAAAFWNLAAEDGPHAIAPFDAAWFARMLQEAAPSAPHDSAHAPDTALLVPSPPSVQRFIDWGEVISVPTLYGRDSELETLHQWTVNDHCQVITILGIGGMGKSSLAITVAHQVAPAFDVVLFRSLQNGPPLAEVLDQVIRAVSIQHVTPPHLMTDKIARLVQLFREHRCLLILDNFEALLQDGALSGTYRAGYEGYRALVQSLGEREHGSCLMLTSREKPGELGPLEGRTAPVRTLQLTGLDARACQRILETKSISATAAHASAMAHFYGGNPLALQLVAEPIRDLFGGDVGAFLATGDAFFSGVGTVLQQQFTRSTPLEQAILRWLAIERELTDVDALLADLGSAATQRSVLTALESLRRRQLIERGPDQAGFTLQPFILEYLSDQLVTTVCQELVDGQIAILHDYALIQATAREYVRRSQERLIATPVLERLLAACGGTDAAAQRLVALLASWRGQPKVEQGHGPGNIINLLRLLRGNLNGLDCSDLLITHLYLQGTNARDAALTGSHLVQAVFDEPFAGIEAIACTPDMRYLAAGTVNGEVWVWEVATRNVLMAVHEHTSAVVGLALSADGRRLASGSGDGTVRLWEVGSARALALFEHPTLIHSVALAEDGQLLASAGGDGVVRLWDVPSGVCLASMEGHTQAVWGVALAADGRLLASASFDGTARLWDLSLVRNDHAQPPRCLAILHGHRAGIYSVALSADARLLATGSADRSVRVWALPAVFNGVEQEAACIAILEGHTDTVRSVALSPDGRFVASGSGDGTARLWNVHTHACVTPFEGHTSAVWSVALSADGQLLASGSTDGTARLWDVRSGTSQMILNGRTNAVVGVALAPDSGMLASGGMDGTVQLWDVPTGTSLATLHGHSNMVVGTSFSPDGQRLASGSADGTVRLWDTRRGVCLATLAGHTNVVRSVAWSADGRLLASASYDGTIRLWDTAVALHDGPGSAACLATLHGHTNMVMSIALAPDGKLLASGSYDQTIRLWDVSNGTCVAVLEGHTSAVWSVALSVDGRLLTSGSTDGTVRLWDVPAAACVVVLEGHTGAVWSVALSADGRRLASGSGDTTARLWDVSSGACLAVLEGHTSAVWSVALSTDGRLLASGSTDGTVRLWDSLTAAPIRTLRPQQPYERMDITNLSGITEAQRVALIALGAVAAPSADTEQLAPSKQPLVMNLPFQPTPFVGREDELIMIARMLSDPACRLLTLLGPGGAGKTRLAIEVAVRHAGLYADGVVFVPLAGVGDPHQIASAIGGALALSFADQPDPTTSMLNYLRERHMLLILDNVEHLLDGIDFIVIMLEHAPQIRMLVTSRERLSLQAEWLFDVGGLAYPRHPSSASDAAHADEPTDYSAVQLFAQRMTQVQPSFALSAATFPTVARICQHVDGMPLAIELAAATARAMALSEIETHIREHLGSLATPFRDVPERHRSLRAVFDHSWNLLNQHERALFSQLAVFRGGWTAEAAEHVAGATLPALAALVDKSLVRHERAAAGAESENRYVMLETVREYALERLAHAAERADVQRRHARYFMELAEHAAAQWSTPTVDAWLRHLHREHDNIRAALQWARESGDSMIGLRLAGALWKFWQGYGYTSEGRAWLDHMLTLDDPHPTPTTMVARLCGLQAAAWLASGQRDDTQATHFVEQSMLLRRALRETTGETNPLVNMARQARTEGQYGRALAALEDALGRHEALRNKIRHGSADLGLALYDLGVVLRVLGLVCREQGNFTRAAALFEESLGMHRTFGDREGVALTLLGLADVARDQGDSAGGREYGEESLTILRDLRIQWAIGFALNTLAHAAMIDGDHAQALAMITESVTLFRELNAYSSLAEVLVTQGQVQRARGAMDAAAEAMAEAARLGLAVGPRIMVAAAMEGLASMVITRDQAAHAVHLLAAAAALRADMGTPLRPTDQSIVEQTHAKARSALGNAAVAALWAEAQGQPIEQLFGAIFGTASVGREY